MAKIRAVHWSRPARRDLRTIWAWYNREASPEVADQMLQKIGRNAERLGRNPMPGRTRDDLRPGLWSLLSHPYAIFFRLQSDGVEVVRVLHERRDFPSALKGDAG